MFKLDKHLFCGFQTQLRYARIAEASAKSSCQRSSERRQKLNPLDWFGIERHAVEESDVSGLRKSLEEKPLKAGS